MATDLKNQFISRPHLADVPPNELAKSLGYDVIRIDQKKIDPSLVERTIQDVQLGWKIAKQFGKAIADVWKMSPEEYKQWDEKLKHIEYK